VEFILNGFDGLG